MKRLLAAAVIAAAVACPTWAEQHGHDPAPSHAAAAEGKAGEHDSPELTSHPHLPPNPAWAKQMLGIIGVLFASALVIGVIVRANMPDEAPVDHSHHDDEHSDAEHDPHPAHGSGGGHGGGHH